MTKLYYVYRIINIINNKIYIGSTSRPELRWQEHKLAAKNKKSSSYNYPLQQDIRRFGEKNFRFEIIDFAYSPTIIAWKEKEYIGAYNSLVKYGHGYNQTLDTSRAGSKLNN